MQLCRFCEPGFGSCVGIIDDDGRVHNATRAGLCDSLRSFLVHPDPWELARTIVDSVPAGPLLVDLTRPGGPTRPRLLAPIDQQEVWASGVTYLRSRDARVQESVAADIYTRVYDAERPELFFKSTPGRTVGPSEPITLREDSDWNVPEPELAVVLSPKLSIVGYTIGNDVSSRRIEGENPLYLPQAKVWVGACALGPAIALAEPNTEDPPEMQIALTVWRGQDQVFNGSINTSRMKRRVPELVSYLGRANSFPNGVFLLTGTGIVPAEDFTLAPGDVVEIEIPGIGVLSNPVTLAAASVLSGDEDVLREAC
jgi:2-dehydro-3-deoxy-D-arabinonate dehydratase